MASTGAQGHGAASPGAGAARRVSTDTAASASTEPRFHSATAARGGRAVKGRKRGAVTGAYLNGMVPSSAR